MTVGRIWGGGEREEREGTEEMLEVETSSAMHASRDQES